MEPVSRPVERCGACKFYEIVDTPYTEEGFCRRHPPVPWCPTADSIFYPETWAQPSVYASGGCGEWQAIESTT